MEFISGWYSVWRFVLAASLVVVAGCMQPQQQSPEPNQVDLSPVLHKIDQISSRPVVTPAVFRREISAINDRFQRLETMPSLPAAPPAEAPNEYRYQWPDRWTGAVIYHFSDAPCPAYDQLVRDIREKTERWTIGSGWDSHFKLLGVSSDILGDCPRIVYVRDGQVVAEKLGYQPEELNTTISLHPRANLRPVTSRAVPERGVTASSVMAQVAPGVYRDPQGQTWYETAPTASYGCGGGYSYSSPAWSYSSPFGFGYCVGGICP